jgi:pyridoxine 5-phosphate synthase
MKKSILLGVNIDHVATLRQARGTNYPAPLQAALIAEMAGADGITAHLREDRRHIQDADIWLLKERIQTRLNFEMGATDEMVKIACDIKPAACCLVPEKREELTTEGGLDVCSNSSMVKNACQALAEQNCEVSLFIDPDFKQIEAAVEVKAPVIELHTGQYADAKNSEEAKGYLVQIQKAAEYAASLGLIVNAGHGLHYHNTQAISAIPEINELNIGHSIIAKAVFSGLDKAVSEMKSLMLQARG